MIVEQLRGVLPSHDPGCSVVVSLLGLDWEVGQVTYNYSGGRVALRLELDTRAGSGRAGRPHDFIAHGIDRPNVVDEAIGKVHAGGQGLCLGE